VEKVLHECRKLECLKARVVETTYSNKEEGYGVVVSTVLQY
jgi:hypothetical protein